MFYLFNGHDKHIFLTQNILYRIFFKHNYSFKIITYCSESVRNSFDDICKLSLVWLLLQFVYLLLNI